MHVLSYWQLGVHSAPGLTVLRVCGVCMWVLGAVKPHLYSSVGGGALGVLCVGGGGGYSTAIIGKSGESHEVRLCNLNTVDPSTERVTCRLLNFDPLEVGHSFTNT